MTTARRTAWVAVVLVVSGCGNTLGELGAGRPSDTRTTRADVTESCPIDDSFNEADLDQQQRLKCAFDPDGYLNPGKVFPTLHRCAELGRMHVHKGKVAFADLPRF